MRGHRIGVLGGETEFKSHGELMNRTSMIQPTLTVLDQEQIEQIDRYSVQILSSVGVRVDSEPARQLFAKAIGPTAIDESRVRIPPELVKWALGTAPSAVDIYDRTGQIAFCLPGPARFGVGVTALYYQDPETDRVTPFGRKDMEMSVRLGGALPNFDVISTVGIVQDVPASVSDLYATLEMTANTAKPLVILISEEEAFPHVLDLLEHLHGDLASRPSIIPYFNPITPLVMNRGTVDKMRAASERGLPFIYSNYGMAGASTPITPAGATILLTAELLAGLTLSQLMKEGTPVILGSLPAFFDMKGMGSFYDPQSYLVDLACAEMMAHYHLPHAGTSGSGMGWGPDLIAAGHQWTNHLISCMGKVGLVPFVGDDLGSKAFSPTVVVYADEVISQARLLSQGFVLDADSAALDEIARVGPGGNFLTSGLTLKLFRRAYYRSHIFPTLTLEEWQARGCPHADGLLRSYTLRLIDGLKAPDDHADLMARGEAFIHAIANRRL
jgi:trimethylamine--corrinoid protein Co-methyltransferase